MPIFGLRPLTFAIAACLAIIVAPIARAQTAPSINFVPNSQEFWDDSKNWTTNYGPAYRDTVLTAKNAPYFVPCTGTYALCFNSGPPPLPCTLTADGRFANCKCTVQSGTNWVLMTAILNYAVYQKTIQVCGVDGSKCFQKPDMAPVCSAIKQHQLIPGAEVISTYSSSGVTDTSNSATNATTKPPLKVCPKAPYAGCMTAGCKKTSQGTATCSCPVFWGIFQLTQTNARCSLGDDLVWSASYDPTLDVTQ